MGEPNKVLWRGIRPTDPAEDIPVTLDGERIVLGRQSGYTLTINSTTVNNADTTIITVPAGKTLYLETCWMHYKCLSDDIGSASLILRDNVGAFVAYLLACVAFVEDNNGLSNQFNPPYEIPQSYYIQVSSNMDKLYVVGGITGYTL